MAKYIKKQGIEEYISYVHKNKAIKITKRVREDLTFRLIFLLLPSAFLSPFLFFIVLFEMFVFYWKEFHSEFLYDPRKVDRYRSVLAPKNSTEALSMIGYQIFEDEIESHLNLVKNDDGETQKRLGQKQKKFEQWSNRWRRVGLGKKLLTTHLLIPGKTGAGKSELVRSIANDACFKTGGGFLYNDGKSDTGLMREFIHQASLEYRETSVNVMNFLKAEFNGESNTFSPLNIMHPAKTVEFLGGLIGGGGSDGNAQYFFQQGKAMLFPVVNMTYIRHKYFHEGYNLEKIFDNTKIQNMVLLRMIAYCMCRDINEMIKTNPVLKSMASSIVTASTDPDLELIERLLEYMTQNATKVAKVKDEINIEFREIKEIYINGFSLLDGYLAKIWSQYNTQLTIASRVLYAMAKHKHQSFFGDNALRIGEIRVYVREMRQYSDKETHPTGLETLDTTYELIDSGLVEMEDLHRLPVVFHRPIAKGGNLESPPNEATQQLSYAQQQWNVLSGLFAMYKHIFGQDNPEIKPEKLIKDNKFLYILLPPLEQDKTQTEILGKIIVATIKEIAAIALLGEKLSIHSSLANIFKDRFTPKPFTFIVLDEYGAYPVDGIDLLLAQIRALNMSAALAVQDNASLKVGGENITSQQRVLANTTKIIAKTEDQEIIDWIKDMLSDVDVEVPKLQRDAHGNYTAGLDVEIQQKKSFDVEKLRDFGNGFALLLFGSKEEDLVFVQSFYRGGSAETIFIHRYINLDLR